MPAQPIYLDAEEEISELIERLRSTPAADVPVVVPARSRIGQSRFNFRLLRDYAHRMGKRVSIVSPDAAIQQMASENGFNAFAAMDEVGGRPVAEPAYAVAGVGAASAPAAGPAAVPVAAPPPERVAPAARTPKLSLGKQRRLMSSDNGVARAVLLGGLLLVVLVAGLFAAILVPSATVTLTAKAQPLTDTTSLDAAPGAAPVAVRQLTATKSASQQFKSTLKDVPATVAKANETIKNSCSGSTWDLKQGQVVSTAANGGGIQFVMQTNVHVADVPQAVDVWAVNPGAAGNVGDHTITNIYNYTGARIGCLSAYNEAAATGGADASKTPQVTDLDLASAQGALEGQLRGTVLDDLNKQTAGNEKLADTVDYSFTFGADHKAGDAVDVFNASVTAVGKGAAYNVDDVKKALSADLGKHIPTGFALTDNAVRSDFHVAQSTSDGHITFEGTSKGWIAPKLDFNKIRSRLLGSSTASARIYLQTLPIESADVREKPLTLPLLPLLNSRINIKYVVDTGAAQPTS